MHNKVYFIGKLYTMYPQEKVAIVEMARNSGTVDSIQVIYDNPTIELAKLVDKDVRVEGIIYTTNVIDGDRRRLNIYCKGTIVPNDTLFENINEVNFTGYLVKPPVNRNTPFGKIITELHIAINDDNNISYYIPVITFNKLASHCINYKVGDQLTITGRFQSRMYEKKLADDQTITKTAYEIAARSVHITKED